MKVGIDVHGCIDKFPGFFNKFSNKLVELGHEVHILTGKELNRVEGKLKEVGVRYTHFYSIVGYHKAIGTKMWQREGRDNVGYHKVPDISEDDNWWMDGYIWNESKGNYAARVGLDIHYDDSNEYSIHFPKRCIYVVVGDNFEEVFGSGGELLIN